MADLTGKKVLIMATDGFEQSELFKPREALLDAGASVKLASIETDPIQGVVHDDFPVVSAIRTKCVSRRVRPKSCARSSMPASRSRRSATRRGC
jgi:putative intracellular protease/amidase